MKHRISPATIIASVALFFSLGGAGMAATGYRITSLWQISPHVRHQLRGPAGPRGATGPPASIGATWNNSYWENGPQVQVVDVTGEQETSTASCNGNDRALTGGFYGAGETVTSSYMSNQNAWVVDANAQSSTGWVQAWVICVTP